MAAAHGHGHGQTQLDAAREGSGRSARLLVSLVVMSGFLLLEVVVGLRTSSLTLLSDAGHMLTDVVGMAMALVALELVRRGGQQAARTYGWYRAEVLTAVLNAALLVGVAVFVLVSAAGRLGDPPEVPGLPLVLVALAGLAANLGVMLALRSDAKSSLAVRGAYLEVLADALGSVGVLVAGLLTALFGWRYADPVVAVLLGLMVLPRAVNLGRAGVRILVQAAPSRVDVTAVRAELAALPGVADVHDLHVWTLTDGMDVATVHLSTSDPDRDGVLHAAREVLVRYELGHATVQVEHASHRDSCGEDAC